jgi:hypothetical protein
MDECITHLEIEDFLEVGERLTRNKEEIMSNEIFCRFFRSHDYLEEGVNPLGGPRNISRVPEERKPTISVERGETTAGLGKFTKLG